ncbi:meiotic recombination protein REC8 homolog [Anolis carolinensis]|uniref:meiotic recombination protein REC8 homolog n=1 Tax=Anolis carolinensis TaxID=28377 RepID=UPI002F2B7E99
MGQQCHADQAELRRPHAFREVLGDSETCFHLFRIPFEEPEEAALALAVVPELPETSFELPLDMDLISLDYVRRLISSKLEQVGEVEFSHLVPLTISRLVVSRFFYLCLVLAATQQVRLEQAEPYGRIYIRPGPRLHRR